MQLTVYQFVLRVLTAEMRVAENLDNPVVTEQAGKEDIQPGIDLG